MGEFRSNRAVRRVRALGRVVGGPSAGELRRRHLDLVEKALLHTLYTPVDRVEQPEFSRQGFRRAIEEAGESVIPISPEAARAQGRDRPAYGQTMVGAKRLRNVRRCVQEVIADGVRGDLIEAGAWRGGVTILIKAILDAYGADDRHLYVADSFAGLPAPNPDLYPLDADDLNYTDPQLAVPLEEVKGNFERYGLLDDRVHFLEGWFADTLPSVRDRSWALIRLDGDLYESITDSLLNLYPGLSRGGYVIVDDFVFDNCRAAVEDFRAANAITDPIEPIDWNGVCWRRGD